MLTLASVMRSEMKKRKLEFSSHPGNLALMRSFVRHFLDSMPISERDRTLMVLGVDEACTNIIRHAYELRDDQLIALSLEIRDDCVRMRLRDYGMQPPVEALHRRRQRDEVIRPGGLGLMMIRNAFDQVDYILLVIPSESRGIRRRTCKLTSLVYSDAQCRFEVLDLSG